MLSKGWRRREVPVPRPAAQELPDHVSFCGLEYNLAHSTTAQAVVLACVGDMAERAPRLQPRASDRIAGLSSNTGYGHSKHLL